MLAAPITNFPARPVTRAPPRSGTLPAVLPLQAAFDPLVKLDKTGKAAPALSGVIDLSLPFFGLIGLGFVGLQALGVALLVFGSWQLVTLVDFTRAIFERIPTLFH